MNPMLLARDMVRGSTKVVVLTGAGISTDSGIADFRGPDGIWTKNPEAEGLSTLEHFVSSPEARRASWERYTQRRLTGAVPNKGHNAINQLGDRLHLLVTQNVDGLHHQAGTDPKRIVEIHGTLREVNCVSHCGYRVPFEEVEGTLCPRCGNYLKPAIVFFGEQLDLADHLKAELAARTCDLFVAVGTTLEVMPIAGTFDIARHAGARTLIINAEETKSDHHADQVVHGSISDLLPFVFS